MDDPYLNLDIHRAYARSLEEIKTFEKQFDVEISKKQQKIGKPRGLIQIIPRFSALALFLGTYIRKRWSRVKIPLRYTERLSTNYSGLSQFDIDGLEETEKQRLSTLQQENPQDPDIPTLLSLIHEVATTVEDNNMVKSRLNEFLQI